MDVLPRPKRLNHAYIGTLLRSAVSSLPHQTLEPLVGAASCPLLVLLFAKGPRGLDLSDPIPIPAPPHSSFPIDPLIHPSIMADPLVPNKLPIKRKPPSTLPPPPPSSQQQQPQVLLQQQQPPPFKFQRIWPEADETRLLQGLLDSAADGLSFPRDLSRFYDRFSTTTAHPYTKAQLSEKLRRLRKKFHALSARLSRGLDSAHLTPHDRSLFHLSKQLWHPSFAASSPFSASVLHRHRTLQVNPARPPSAQHHRRPEPLKEEVHAEEEEAEKPGSTSPPPPPPEVREWDRKKEKIGSLPSGGLGGVVAKAVMDVFDGALEEVKAALDVHTAPSSSSSSSSTTNDLDSRWREQRALEFDALSRRLKLVLERSLHQ